MMPQIIVTADRTDDRTDGDVMLCERVNATDFESEHFAALLVERLGWAVNDAHEAEQTRTPEKRGPGAVRTRRTSPAQGAAAATARA
jgi:hypothetical protein